MQNLLFFQLSIWMTMNITSHWIDLTLTSGLPGLFSIIIAYMLARLTLLLWYQLLV